MHSASQDLGRSPSRTTVVPFTKPLAKLGLASELRSTLILSSLESLRTGGLMDRYHGLLAPSYAGAIDHLVAGVWLPMEVAVAHYDACERLGLTLEEQLQLGAAVSERVHGSFLMLLRAARKVGATPWTALSKTAHMYDRLFQGGGGVGVRKLGPKEARLDLVGVPALDVPYFRHALRGVVEAGASLFCSRCYVRELRRPGLASASLRISWV